MGYGVPGLLLGVVGASDQGAGFHVAKASLAGGAGEGIELGRRPVSFDGEVPGSGAQVLADGDDVDAVAGEVIEDGDYLVGRFAEAEHEATLGKGAGRELPGGA